jgi:hypothetical protein
MAHCVIRVPLPPALPLASSTVLSWPFLDSPPIADYKVNP